MNILRWLMKHPIMLAWLLAITAILLNFGLGGNKAGTAHKEVAQVDAAHQAAPAAAADHGQAPAAATQAAAPQQAVVATETAPVAAAAAPVATEAAAPVTTATAPEAAPAVTAAAPVATVEVPSAPAAAAVVTPEAATAPVADANSEADLLRAAREAYWSNEFDNAAGFYTSLLKQTPDSLQYKGELANVFWKQGNSQQAAALFAELAPQLQAQGRSTEANNMRLYVEMVDPALAKTIK
ncbi:hypothetical protein [Thiothrix unzii]|uniref:Tetratricopeptide repeat protein n=1 Tax=Thiothrix unzii TaxID=111769 RepID=A0A975F8U8_9GAMM|nr:hypothetical protein [Thiothrix unzii]QTR53561.1 hypothetical protein J9260_00260 [Thiothrix unzii]